jgi:hypothetical protein
MPTLPETMIRLLAPFRPLFSRRVWGHVEVLLAGTILTPGCRTVTAALRVMGLGRSRQFQRYHRVLNRAVWSGRAVSRVLLGLLIQAFAPAGPVVLGVDETLERRRGAKIAAKGIYRDPVRSSRSHFVKASGLRWVCLMLLVPIPWAGRVWALPFLTALAPSERYDRERRRRHKPLTTWAGQLLLLVRRWLPRRALVVVADSTYACLELLDRCQRLARPITVVTRLRLDAALYAPAPPRRPGQIGRPRLKGQRLPTLAARVIDPRTRWRAVTVANWYGRGACRIEVASATAVWYHTGLPPVPLRWVLIRDPLGRFEPQALLCTDVTTTPDQILAWFVRRWPVEVTFQEARRHLGLETQRQWSEPAIRRTTPALLGLFSVVILLAHERMRHGAGRVRQAVWYPKDHATFADALALVRADLWAHLTIRPSSASADMVKVPRAILQRLTDTLCYAP